MRGRNIIGGIPVHAEVREWVARWCAVDQFVRTLEVGSRDINGGVRDLIRSENYFGVDLYAGPGVDRVCDARDLGYDGQFDLVLCLEVLEHERDPEGLIDTLGRLAKPGGLVVATAGGVGREPHSAHDGGALRWDEHYGNLTERHLGVSWGEVLGCEIKDTDWRVVWRKF